MSLSVNTWQPEKSDQNDRLVEAATRFIFGSLFSSLDENLTNEFLNPFEDSAESNESTSCITNHSNNLDYLTLSLNECGIIDDINSSEKLKLKLKLLVNEIIKPNNIKSILSKLN